MKYNIIMVSSVTYAMKAKNELAREGINGKIEKIKKLANLRGCGYGVVVKSEELDRAVDIMQVNGIKLIEILPYRDGDR